MSTAIRSRHFPFSETPARIMETARPVVISNAMRVDFRSELNQRHYSISIALPLVECPENGCPVLYVLDGDWYFGSAVEAVRNNAPGTMVVGIGYPDKEAYVQSVLERHQPLPDWAKDELPFRAAICFERIYDLSLPASDEVLAGGIAPESKITARDVGGLDAFLEVLEAEIKPRVAAMAPVSHSNLAIFGHSLGGLAVLHALFLKPRAFRTFIAASPSIWWSEQAVLRNEAKFAEAVRAGVAAPRVLITAGSEEQTADPKVAAKLAMDAAEYALRIGKTRMVENARELTERLKALPGSGGFEVEEYAVFAKQDHGLSPWPALGRAVSFAFPQ